MEFGTEFVGTRIAVIFSLDVPAVERHTRLNALGNPVLDSHDGSGLYIVAVPDGQDYYWIRKYRAVVGVVSVEEVRQTPRAG
jgi:hypothetical protein